MQYRLPKVLNTGLLKYIDLLFIAKFLIFLLLLYYFHIFFLGITTPEGKVYSSFLEHNLNYIGWLTSSIVYTAKFITSFFGLDAQVENFQFIKSSSGVAVEVWLPCLGLSIMSFWIAFVASHVSNWKRKLMWCFVGSLVIWFINCWRIALLLLALDRKWYDAALIDHHTLFNIVAYAVICFLIYMYYKENKRVLNKNTTTVAPLASAIF